MSSAALLQQVQAYQSREGEQERDEEVEAASDGSEEGPPRRGKNRKREYESVDDLPEGTAHHVPVDLSFLFSKNNRGLAFVSPIVKTSKGLSFTMAPYLSIPSLTKVLKLAFAPAYNYKLVSKRILSSRQQLGKWGIQRQIEANLRMVNRTRMGFFPNRKFSAVGLTDGARVDAQVNAVINRRPIPRANDKGLLTNPTLQEYHVLGKDPWNLSRLDIEILLPESRSFLCFVTAQHCVPIKAQIGAWDREMKRGTLVEQLWLRTDPLTGVKQIVLIEMKLGQDDEYDRSSMPPTPPPARPSGLEEKKGDPPIVDLRGKLKEPYEAQDDSLKNQHLLQVYFEKRMLEYTLALVVDLAWLIRINRKAQCIQYDLGDDKYKWVEAGAEKAVERIHLFDEEEEEESGASSRRSKRGRRSAAAGEDDDEDEDDDTEDDDDM